MIKKKFHLLYLIIIFSLLFTFLWELNLKTADTISIHKKEVEAYVKSIKREGRKYIKRVKREGRKYIKRVKREGRNYIRVMEIKRIDSKLQKNNILFIGDSFILGLDVSVIHPLAVNFGIAGDTTENVLYRIKDYKSLGKAEAIFLNVGVNDLLKNKTADDVYFNIKKIIRAINGRVFLSAIHPLDERVKEFKRTSNQEIKEINERLARFCKIEPNCFFVDTFLYLTDQTGNLNPRNHIGDGLHLSPAGYKIWMTRMKLALKGSRIAIS